ncbi:MAG TPA: 4-hydroxy-3-methylbut-2-enyl diphosphate reductase [Oligoflexia bacterium]|nr:4-hydroxy-3-methylbut-2-enyl diphosphate reductase [Oligoflexia bacterium]HMP27084.1 4-hydroxy-3-methylbut-2-enyl diphosphate reductase [Oligoflexia bacterium]
MRSSFATDDPRRQDLSPRIIGGSSLRFKLPRFFGFCYGVQNAIEIAYKAIEKSGGSSVYLISEIIHNHRVNSELAALGVKFLQDTSGKQLVDYKDLRPSDTVIVPAFGAPIKVLKEIEARGIDIKTFDGTCPFVEKVWRRAVELGGRGYTILIHGKFNHEETRATFSRAAQSAPTLVILNLSEAEILADFILGKISLAKVTEKFNGKHSDNFDFQRDLNKVGVVNQTTMLASETAEIGEFLEGAYRSRFGSNNIREHFADFRDTLCYATYENQEAARALIESGGDLALVIGGYNSSNTSHLVEMCEVKYPTYYIQDDSEILSQERIRHYKFRDSKLVYSDGWLPKNLSKPLEILVTAGASCPDALIERVIEKIGSFFNFSAEEIFSSRIYN